MRRDAKPDTPKKASRSHSTFDLKASESENESELRDRRAKSVFDLRKGIDKDNEVEGSKLKAFLNFFRNLRPNKEKEADKVISLADEETQEKPKPKTKRRKEKKKVKIKTVSSDEDICKDEGEADEDETPRNEDSTLPRRNGNFLNDDSDSFSDLSLDSLTLPPEKQRRPQRPQPPKKKKKEEGGFLEAETKSCTSEDSSESGQSNFSKLRRRFRSRKNSTIEEVEEMSDQENKKQKHRRDDAKSEKKSKKKKKKGSQKSPEKSQESGEEDEDPEVIVEELKTPRSRASGRLEDDDYQKGAVHLTYLSSDSDEESATMVERRKQNFLEEKKGFRFLRRTPREKKANSSSATRITPLALGGDSTFSLSGPLFPSDPWDPVEYDPEREEQLDEDDFISAEQLQNLLADPSLRGAVAVIDTRDYTDFLHSRILLARHVSEFENAEGELMEDICSTFSTFIIYDANGRTLSLMDSPLSRLYDFLKSSSDTHWRIFVVAGGHDKIRTHDAFLLSSSTSSTASLRHLPPSSVERGFLLWGGSVDMTLATVAQTFSVSHAVTFAGDVDATVPAGVESMLVKVESDSVKLFEHLETVIKFLLLGKREDQVPTKVLIVGDAPDNRASAVVVAFMMFRHHWTLRDAFAHVSSRRKSMNIGKGNAKALQKFEKRLFGKLISKESLKVVAEDYVKDDENEEGKKKGKKKKEKKDNDDEDEEMETKHKKKKKKAKNESDDDEDEDKEKKSKKKKKGKKDDDDENEKEEEESKTKKKRGKKDEENDAVEDKKGRKGKKETKTKGDDEDDEGVSGKRKKKIRGTNENDGDMKSVTEIFRSKKKKQEIDRETGEKKADDDDDEDEEVEEERNQATKKGKNKKYGDDNNNGKTYDDTVSNASSSDLRLDSSSKKKSRWRREKKNGDLVVDLRNDASDDEEKRTRKPKKKGGLFSRRRASPLRNDDEE